MAPRSTNAIVTFRGAAGVVGVGFLIDDRRLLTCAHVVNQVLGRDHDDRRKPVTPVEVEFSLVDGHPTATAQVTVWGPTLGDADERPSDIAGLELLPAENAPPGTSPPGFARPQADSVVHLYGYPADRPRPDGAWTVATLRHRVRTGLIQIDSNEGAAHRVQPGYSGSPLLDARERVVGMLVTASTRGDQHDGYAIPGDRLRAVWPRAARPPTALPSAPVRLRRVSWKWPVSLALVVVLGALLGIWRPWTSASAPARTDCVPLEVSVSTEKDELLAEFAESYNAARRTFGDGKCARVHTTGLTSGTAQTALADGWPTAAVGGRPRPQVWLPTSSLWLELLRYAGHGDLIVGTPRAVTSSVLVVAMPERMAKAMRDRDDDIGWADILTLAQDERGWGAFGHPEWGRFVLGRDNPHYSTSGLAATVATYFAAVGRLSGITEADLANGAVTSFVHGIESSVLRYGKDATEFMGDLYEQDRGRASDEPSVSAVVVQEQLVYLYNRGAPTGDLTDLDRGQRPHERMVAVYPREGTIELDHPFVVLSSASAAQRAAAADFYAFLTEGAQQQRFIDLGFRALAHRERPTSTLADTVGGSARSTQQFVTPPEPAVLHAMQQAWDGTRKRARVLLVIDVSGSMNEPVNAQDPNSGTKLDLVKPAAKRGLKLLGDDDQVGIWTFADDRAQLLPMSRVGNVRPQLDGIIDGLTTGSDTALYKTTCAAKNELQAGIDPSRINAVIVLSDGRNHPADDAGRAALLQCVDAANQETSVRIFTVPYGADADTELLGKIADVTKAQYYDAAIDPKNIDEVMVSVFSNFGGLT
ncbi:substrate-binding domain-containing protein [Actinophytocola sp.]|uniref:substrate-binding domain-containing protein n=1 Tax=Actinophytocola sp. TaxID=1872138 RepID=UPI00389B2662